MNSRIRMEGILGVTWLEREGNSLFDVIFGDIFMEVSINSGGVYVVGEDRNFCWKDKILVTRRLRFICGLIVRGEKVGYPSEMSNHHGSELKYKIDEIVFLLVLKIVFNKVMHASTKKPSLITKISLI